MTKYTSEEIKNRLSNIGEAIGTIALEYIVELEKENEQLKAQNEKMKNWCNCQNYLECLTNYVEKTKQSYKKEFCYNCKKWKLKER